MNSILSAVTACGLCLLLVGCDNSSKMQVGVSSAPNELNPSKETKSTVIHLPGGTGIDFKREPTGDVTRKSTKGDMFRVIQYEFNEKFDVVDSSISSILSADGYARNEQVDEKYPLSVIYRKAKAKPVLFRYGSSKKSEGSKTTLMLWWYL